MKVSLIQANLHWEDRDKNLHHLGVLMDRVDSDSKLVILPEMFSTGFTMKPEQLAELHPGPALDWMRKKSKEKQLTVCGSVSVKDSEKFFNRLYWIDPNDNILHYNKRHLFRMASEDAHYSCGHQKIITRINDWNICPLICYDLRFPVWSRNRFDKTSGNWDYDVLIYVANWPEVRNYPWKQLLIARAIENQSYVIGVNRVGRDGNGYEHSGDSMVVGPKGEILASANPHEEAILNFNLDKAYLNEFRRNFPAGLDADEFELK